MTDIFAKEVAENVWGWKLLPYFQSGYNRWYDEKERSNEDKNFGWKFQESNETALTDEVNSWQGFGRTVEAMGNRGIQFCVMYDEKWGMDELGFAIGDTHYSIRENINGGWNPMEPTTLIKAAHQAALDAVKEEG